ncbi:MAG: hypothetical protein SFU21_08930 [Flavihumibacter sp.]|nr:hypothetical protein [Flavihumibacter sp.]
MFSYLYLIIIGSSSLFVWFILSFLENKSGASLEYKNSVKINNKPRREIILLKIYKYSPNQIAAVIEEVGKKLTDNTVEEILYALNRKYGEWNNVPLETNKN